MNFGRRRDDPIYHPADLQAIPLLFVISLILVMLMRNAGNPIATAMDAMWSLVTNIELDIPLLLEGVIMSETILTWPGTSPICTTYPVPIRQLSWVF
jgi:hypothetical protein